MKMVRIFKVIVLAVLVALPILTQAKDSDNYLTREINTSFDVSESSDIYFKHRRGPLTVKYIEGKEGRVEATIKIKGDDEQDMQEIMDAMTIEVLKVNGGVEIKTANKIVSWNVNSGFWGRSHKIVLSNGKTYSSKVEDITIDAILYLPKVHGIFLNNRYDDILIEKTQSEKLGIDLHSGILRADDILSDAHIKLKYSEVKARKINSLILDSHDSKGNFGDIGELEIKDKYSEFVFMDLASMEADLHDSDLEMQTIEGDANIKDKYSEIRMHNMKSGVWVLHDSKIRAGNIGNINVMTKYSDIEVETAKQVNMDCHDDEFRATSVELLDLRKSKYTTVKIDKVDKYISLSDSHDDEIEIRNSSDNFQGLLMNAKYTNLIWPMPSGKGYNIKADMKYGDLQYSEKGLKELRYVKDGSDIEVNAVAADGTKGVDVIITCHDCDIRLKN